jgi:hypothetical protein
MNPAPSPGPVVLREPVRPVGRDPVIDDPIDPDPGIEPDRGTETLPRVTAIAPGIKPGAVLTASVPCAPPTGASPQSEQ